MRDAFADALLILAREDERIVLLSGDIGNRMFDAYKEAFPTRFFNCGVAEANLITTAAGLAMTGLRPVVYTIASFLVYRPFEQIRIDVAYHDLPVVMVGVGGGVAYASNGPTHHATEDLSALRSIPGLTLVAAADAHEVKLALRALVQEGKPSYLRIGKKKEPLVYEVSPENWNIGRIQWLRDRVDATITLLAQGAIIPEVLKSAEILETQGYRVRVCNVHTLRPLDKEGLEHCMHTSRFLFTVEEHSIDGALGSVVSEFIAERDSGPNLVFRRIGFEPTFLKRTTNISDARIQAGIDYIGLTETILKVVRT